MKTLILVAALLALAGCQNPDPAAYNHAAAHPFRISQASVRVSLVDATAESAAEKARLFAAERPNNGSTFIISAPVEIAGAARVALLRAGVDARDIRLVPDGMPAELVRTDRFAAVTGCDKAPKRVGLADYLFGAEDGFRHDNGNSELLGCAVRRNVVEMMDDPRVLSGPVHAADRVGARGSSNLDKYGKGENPASAVKLPNWKTSEMTQGTDQ